MKKNIIRNITSGKTAKAELIKGDDIVANTVSSTFGYRGRTVLIEYEYGKNFPTKDGYNVLQEITLENSLQNLACELLKEASQKTVDFAGDGTTCTIVLSQALIKYSNEMLKKGLSAIDIKQNIEKSRDLILDFLTKLSTPITDKLIHDVAMTSANGDSMIADIVAEAFITAGENGSVGHFRSNTDETFLETIEGTLLDSGYADEGFINAYSDRTASFQNNPLVVLSHINFKTVNQILPFVEFAAENNRELVFVSDMEFQVKDVLLKNKKSGALKVAVVTPIGYSQKRKDLLSDLALVCGTEMISTISGDSFEGRAAEFLGTCKSVTIGSSDTIFIPSEDSDKSIVESKINELKEIELKSSNPLEKKYIKERISKLSGIVSIIKVGGITESELKERIDRVDDAVCAVRSAKEEGVVAGGGVALMNAMFSLEKKLDDATANAITSPFFKILDNASYIKEPKEFKVPDYPKGIDVKNFKEIDMFKAGIVDSTKVIKNALINAVSVANTILMTDNVITFKRERDE